MPLSSDNRLMVLQLLAESGRVSRKGLFDLLPFSSRNNSVVIKKLMDKQAVGVTGNTLNDKSHFLLEKGREELSSLNPQRYTPDLWELNNLLKRNPKQSRLCGDVAVAMSLAGYTVHPADKPGLPATTPEIPDDSPSLLMTLYRNERPQTYGVILPNDTQYTRRITPVNCYYDRTQLKLMRGAEAANSMKNARAAGVLFTPSHLFRVYHGEDHNIKYFSNGEKHFISLMEGMFEGYKPPEKRAVMLVGREFEPAVSLMDIHMNGFKDPHSKGTLLGPDNLGQPLHYMPMQEYALDLLRVMRYPHWHKSIAAFASELLFDIRNQPLWTYKQGNRKVFIVADLNLSHLVVAIKQTRRFPDQQFVFVCLHWQAAFVQSQIRNYCEDYSRITLECLPTDFLTETAIGSLNTYWDGDES